MEDVARSVGHLSNYIVSTLSKTASSLDHSASTGSGVPNGANFETSLGITDHRKFFRNLRSGFKDSNVEERLSTPCILARLWPPTPKEPALSVVASNGDVIDGGNLGKIFSAAEKPESLPSIEENRHTVQASPSVQNSWYTTLSGTKLDSFVDAEASSAAAAVSKEELGRATWTFLHTVAAQFPDHPTRQQQRDVKELMKIISRIYPCKECADHFKDLLKAHPVETKSAEQLAQWMCKVHNVVNRSLGKAQFPCNRVDLRWAALDCNEGACDLHGKLYRM